MMLRQYIKRIIYTIAAIILAIDTSYSKCDIDLSFVPQIDKMPSDITELLALPKVSIPDSTIYNYIVQTQNIEDCNLGLDIYYNAYATFKIGDRVYLIYDADSLYYATLYICEIIPDALYPPSLIIATNGMRQNTGFLSDNNRLSIYSEQGNIEYHIITESTIDLSMGLRHFNEVRVYDNKSYALELLFKVGRTESDSTLHKLFYPDKQPDRVQSSVIDSLIIGSHTYEVVESYAEFNHETCCHVFLYEPVVPASSIKVYEIYNNTPFQQIDCTRIGDTINIMQFQTTEQGWINPLKFTINLAL